MSLHWLLCIWFTVISVEETKSKSTFKCISADLNEKLWIDSDVVITKMPSYLKGTFLFQVPFLTNKGNSSYYIHSKGRADLYICTATDNKRGWFSNTLTSPPYLFVRRDEKLNTGNGPMLIFEKKNFDLVVLPPIETESLLLAIFVKSTIC